MVDSNKPDGANICLEEIWKFLNTPVGDLDAALRQAEAAGKAAVQDNGSKRCSLEAGQKTERNIKRLQTRDEKPRATQPRAARQAEHDEARKSRKSKRDESKRHVRHTFRETTERIGFQAQEEASHSGNANPRMKSKIHKPGIFTLLLGVIMPVAALLVETTTHVLAKNFVDPFPTISHVLLFLLIPLSNFLSWLAARVKVTPFYSMMSLASGMALGIAILYTFMLAPLTPAFINLSLSAFGIGFLGLAPLFSIPVTLLSGKTVVELAERQRTFFDAHQMKHLGHIIILVLVVVVELPSTLTRANLAATDSPDSRQQAIRWLRQWGDREVLLRACYEHSGEPTDILGALAENHHPIGVDKARLVYYQVTGVAFNSVPIPASFRGTIKSAGLISDPTGLNDDIQDQFDLDPDIAGELISGVARGLSVSNSSIAGSLDSSDGTGRLDWDFTFENVSNVPREARAKILLPPNAVVTRATLWLNEDEKEAVIEARDVARSIYVRSVTEHKRDPLLVSMSGKDSVLVQCYPVAKGTSTRIRLHIVTPLTISKDNQVAMQLPTFAERNFAITIPHKISIKGTDETSIFGAEWKSVRVGDKVEARAQIDNSLMSRFAVTPVTRANRSSRKESLPDSRSAEVLPLTVIVDKSITMEPYVKELTVGLRSAPQPLKVSILEVKDSLNWLCQNVTSDKPEYRVALEKMKSSRCEGGQCDAIALHSVFSRRFPTGQNILWIHAAQPYSEPSLSNAIDDALMNNKRNGINNLFDLQVASGPNEVLGESYKFRCLKRVERTGNLSADVTKLLSSLAAGTSMKDATINDGGPDNASSEKAQLKAYELCLRSFWAGDIRAAAKLAKQFHIVTPVSSAVVTEQVPLPLVKSEKDNENSIDKVAALITAAEIDKSLEVKKQDRWSPARLDENDQEQQAPARLQTQLIAEQSQPAAKTLEPVFGDSGAFLQSKAISCLDSRSSASNGAVPGIRPASPESGASPPFPSELSHTTGADGYPFSASNNSSKLLSLSEIKSKVSALDSGSVGGMASRFDSDAGQSAPILQGSTNGMLVPHMEELSSDDINRPRCSFYLDTTNSASSPTAGGASAPWAILFPLVLSAMFIVFKTIAAAGREELRTRPAPLNKSREG